MTEARVRPVVPIQAATVMLLDDTRDTDRYGRLDRLQPGCGHGTTSQSLKVFMVRRPVKSEFAADVYVFPGGKVDLVDYETRFPPGRRRSARDVEFWDVRRPLYAAAIRELFEETGLLLARRRDQTPLQVGDDEMRQRYARHRVAVQLGALTLNQIADVEDLELADDSLRLFSRWITPDSLPKRFDTYFFVGALPAGQYPQMVQDDAGEVTDALWIEPAEALTRNSEGAFPLVFPTVMHLRRLASFSCAADALEAALKADLEPVVPRLVLRDGRQEFLLPGDAGYASAQT